MKNDLIRILIADDDALIREGLKIILELDNRFMVVGCVDNGEKAVEFCNNNEVDIALMDVRMPKMNGLAASKIISSNTSVKPLILTTFDDDEFIIDSIKSGAKGYLLKNTPPERMKDAIKLVYDGGTVMQDAVMDRLRDSIGDFEINKKVNNIGDFTSKFSEREMEVIEHISKGMSNKEIAKKMFVSEGTVKNYITSILNKTGLEHRTQIAIYYIKGGRL
jgi:DNA-binding NarL/FixJ family response regulator